MIDKTGILVAETVVILPPYMRSEEVIQRGDGSSPRYIAGGFQPLGMLIEHGINNVNKGLITGE
jgi:hypothetical protein